MCKQEVCKLICSCDIKIFYSKRSTFSFTIIIPCNNNTFRASRNKKKRRSQIKYCYFSCLLKLNCFETIKKVLQYINKCDIFKLWVSWQRTVFKKAYMHIKGYTFPSFSVNKYHDFILPLLLVLLRLRDLAQPKYCQLSTYSLNIDLFEHWGHKTLTINSTREQYNNIYNTLRVYTVYTDTHGLIQHKKNFYYLNAE